MVVTSKADEAPGRTVDVHQQNRNLVLQAHHAPTPSPFHLADRVHQEKNSDRCLE